MKHIKTHESFLSQLSYEEVVGKINLERPIKDYIKQKYPHINISDYNTLSKTSLNKVLRLTKKDINLKKIVNKYLKFLKELEVKYDSEKYNL